MHCCANWWQFLCNFQKSDQTSTGYLKKKKLLEKKENSLVICRTHQERWYPSWSPWQLEYYPMHSIESRSCLLGCHGQAHQGIVSSPDPAKEKPSSVIIRSISANYNCTERTGTDGKKWSFSLTIKWYKQQQTVCFSWSMFRKASLMCSATKRQMFVLLSIWWSSTSP